MSARAAIVVTGTEVLSGRVSDRNGPWLAERLREHGVDVAQITIVGDRPDDILATLRWQADQGVELIVTSGGLGPTADDLTASVVAEFCARPVALDAALEQRIADILRPMSRRWPKLDLAAVRESNRKQAMVPQGATVLEPVGTAPGLIVSRLDGPPTVVVLPGPPRELQPMWRAATATPAFARAVAGATTYRQEMIRLFGIPESELAATLRRAAASGVELDRLEVTTCLRRGEIEIVTRYEPDAQPTYDELAALLRERHADTLFSDDGSSVDEQVADLLRRTQSTVAVAESCTGGLVAARLTDRAGSSEYVIGGVVAYADRVKTAVVGVPAELIERVGAVSAEVAAALAEGARDALGASIGVGVTGIAGPGGGSPEKPVGLVHIAVAGERRLARRLELGGGRADIRDRTTTHVMHLLRMLLIE